MRTAIAHLRRHRLVTLTTLALLIGAVATAWAYFSATGAGTASARVGSLSAPANVTATPGAGTVALGWDPVTGIPTGTVSYYITRDGQPAAGNCGTPNAPISNTNCTDEGLSAGEHTYTVTAVWRTWTATSASQQVTVAAGATEKIVLTASTGDLASGSTRTITATVEDADGNTISNGPDSTAAVTFAQTGGSGSVGGLSTVTATGGVATATVTGKAAGGVTLGASASLADGNVSSNPLTFNVTAGPPVFLQAFLGNWQQTTVGTAFADRLAALVEDDYGNPVPGDSVTFTAPSTGASGTFAGGGTTTTATTDGAGLATAPVFTANTTTGTTFGEYTVNASADGNTVGFFLTNKPGPASKLTFTQQPRASTPGIAFTTQPTVAVEDEYGNPAPGGNVTLQITDGTGADGATLTCAANPVSVDYMGVATFSGCAIDKAGTGYTLTATDGNLTPAVSDAFDLTAPGACPCTIFSDSDTPDRSANDNQGGIELGVRFRSDTDGYITGVRFYKPAEDTGQHIGHLWTNDGQLLATATFTGESASGWQQATFPNPVKITAGTTYVASYYSPSGYFAVTPSYFSNAGHDSPPLHALQDGLDGANGVFKYGADGFPNQAPQPGGSNYWPDAVFNYTATDTTPPTVASVTPTDAATSLPITGTTVTARFDEPLDSSTVNANTFVLRTSDGTQVEASVTYDAATWTATLTPNADLSHSITYTATVKGGSGGVTDSAGNPLAQDYSWSFSTAAATPLPQGPGGPILLMANPDDPYTSYYAEILRTEGLDEFAVKDSSQVTADTLKNYDVVLLGQRSLTDAQASMLEDWVNGGGDLIAMRPDAKLAGLLGLGSESGTLSNGYIKIDTSRPPGQGITGDTMQFHDTADEWTTAGARTVATLYSDATTATSNPAVTLNNVGSNGGQAAAFTYDLARSIVQTRQGNPAWAGQSRDGQTGPIRADNLFYPDWINMSKVAIPQADEQQRLLANLITEMEDSRMPLPRFWYFPRGLDAAVVMTSDDEGSGLFPSRLDQLISASPAGCSVDDWQCIRQSVYIIWPDFSDPATYVNPVDPITDDEVASYQNDGFDIGLHLYTGCADYTDDQLNADFTDQLNAFAQSFPSLAAPATERTHCVAWSDWAGTPKAEAAHGIRMDLNYYPVPPDWVNNQAGMFTGSGMPQRFADTDGSIIDVYQEATEVTDESGFTDIPGTVNTLLDNALGADGYYGAFTVNLHTNRDDSADVAAIVNNAQQRGVPVISAKQLLTWTDGRNQSSFTNESFTNGQLHFTVNQASGANGLNAMLPVNTPEGKLQDVTYNGTDVNTSTRTIKGVDYAFFTAQSGDYAADYAKDTTPPAVSQVAAQANADGTATITWSTDEPSDSRVDYGTSTANLDQSKSDDTLSTSHSIDVSGLSNRTTYYYRVTSQDEAGNSATSPAPPADPNTFQVPAAQLVDSAVPDFAAGTTDNTLVGETAAGMDGEIQLAPAVAEEFDGTALPPDWTATVLGDGGTATVSRGTLTVDGAQTSTNALYDPGHTLEFEATFSADPYQHVGFGNTLANPPWAIFSTGGGSLPVGFYARTAEGSTMRNTPITGIDPTQPHRYQIVWTTSSVDYYVDGTEVDSAPIEITDQMRPIASDLNVGGGSASVYWLRMSPYSTTGTFTSRVLDAGAAGANWTKLDAATNLPAGTSISVQTRSGNTSTPDGSWSDWQDVAADGTIASPSGRYIQYRATLATTDATQTPTLQSVTISAS